MRSIYAGILPGEYQESASKYQHCTNHYNTTEYQKNGSGYSGNIDAIAQPLPSQVRGYHKRPRAIKQTAEFEVLRPCTSPSSTRQRGHEAKKHTSCSSVRQLILLYNNWNGM